jgi:subtilisin family serine protease
MVQLYGNKAINKMSPIAIVIGDREQQAAVIGSATYALANSDTAPQWNDAIVSHNILGPGCLTAPICVGSTSHRLRFRNIDGQWKENFYDSEEAGLWSPFSSVGPTLDERTKPDICAPGRNVISTYSSYYRENHPTSTDYDVATSEVNGRNYPWHVDSGTSMACPVAAGIIALWLQAKPNLTRDDIMGILQRTSRQPEEALSYPNSKYGYGEIDAYRGLLYLLGLSGIKEITSEQPRKVQVVLQDDCMRLCFDEPLRQPLDVALYGVGGSLVVRHHLNSGTAEQQVGIGGLPTGVYAVQLHSQQPGITGSFLIRKPR